MRALALLLLLAGGPVLAGMIPDQERAELTAVVLKNFWGRAKLANGEFVQPSSEEERNTVPVSKAAADRAFDAGETSGLAQWCGVQWRLHYLTLTQSARARGLTEKQVAFVSVLHGVAQGRVASVMSRSGACPDDVRGNVEKQVQQSKERGFAVP